MRLLRMVGLSLTLLFTTSQFALAQTWSAGLAVASVEGGRAGGTVYRSSARLQVSWTAPADAVHHYVLTLTDGVTCAPSNVEVTDTRVTVSGLKSGTAHTATLKACLDEACATSLDADATASGQTAEEYWQVQGTDQRTRVMYLDSRDGYTGATSTQVTRQSAARSRIIQPAAAAFRPS